MTNGRNYGLDGLRGIAALIVICHHFHKVGLRLTGGGHLAVDFFFLLSGYVIARSYEPKLLKGWGFWAFTRARVVRLYPLYAIGAVLGLVQHLVTGSLGDPEALPAAQSVPAFVLSLFMLPALPSGSELFPLNGPSWSLFFEMIINLMFAGFLYRARNRSIALLAAVSAGWLIAWGIRWGTVNVGWGWENYDAGLARVGCSFLGGVLFSRLGARTPPRESWIALLNFPLLTVALMAPIRYGRPRDLFFVLVVSPAVLWLGTRYDVPRRARKICTIFGEISYPIYAVHFPIILLSTFVARRLGVPDAVTVPSVVVGLCGFCYWLGTRVDVPLRQGLFRLLGERKTTQTADS